MSLQILRLSKYNFLLLTFIDFIFIFCMILFDLLWFILFSFSSFIVFSIFCFIVCLSLSCVSINVVCICHYGWLYVVLCIMKIQNCIDGYNQFFDKWCLMFHNWIEKICVILFFLNLIIILKILVKLKNRYIWKISFSIFIFIYFKITKKENNNNNI